MAKDRTIKTVRSLDGRTIKEVNLGGPVDAVEKYDVSAKELGTSAGTSNSSAKTAPPGEWSTTVKRDPFLHDLMT